MRRVSIFGATGSIGANTIDLIRRDRNAYDVVALTGGRNVDALARDARDLGAALAVTAYDDCLDDLKAALSGSGVEVAAGSKAILEAAARPADWVMSAIVGAAGLAPGLKALEHGTTLALANKESLVTAGPLLLETARKYGAQVLPVDSEHSAIFQAMQGESLETVERVIITASGGAFRDWPIEDLAKATLEQASSHPNWAMGQRITIDSASMFNKALEVIETKEFFGVDPSRIEVLIHPESLVHAIIGHRDGGLMAHLGPADMRHAIGYALSYPDRASLPVDRLDFAAIGQLNFKAPETERYPALDLAREVMQIGGLAGAVFNGAKEAALDAFIDGRLGFVEMASVVSDVIEIMSGESLGNAAITLEGVAEADQTARRLAQESVNERKR